MPLTPVVRIDEEKCVNCHMCISVCPVKYCIDGSGETVTINHDLCIGCGNCIRGCTHEARLWQDDFDSFMKALSERREVVAVMAPAVASNFPDQYLNLNGYLESLGVKAIFDVSFGAELTVKSYLEHVKQNSPDMVVAQPCPTIVTYLEIYQPELLRHLAPADSPMLHTIKMIREYYPKYRNALVAVISPCLAKRREFDEVGLGDFNVTFKGIDHHLKTQGIDLSAYEQADFANPPAERAVLFSTPGGLMRTVQRENPAVVQSTRKIEGPHVIYDYLKALPELYDRGMHPLLIDCLNCEIGCNGGPGTLNEGKSPDETEYHVERRRIAMQKKLGKSLTDKQAKKKIGKLLERYWKPGLYDRVYQDRSASLDLKKPSPQEAHLIYERMLKTSQEDHLNCASCGYNSCEAMALAIHNGLNKPENCHHYEQEVIRRQSGDLSEMYGSLHTEIGGCQTHVDGIRDFVTLLDTTVSTMASALEESSAAIEQVMISIQNISRISQERRTAIGGLVELARSGEDEMTETVTAIDGISTNVTRIAEMVEVINDVASRTNLLSMNAAIEAAHAGSAGAGFAVVAEEIKRLAEETGDNARNVANTLKTISDHTIKTTHVFESAGHTINTMVGDVRTVADTMGEMLNQTDEMSTGSSQVLEGLAALRKLNHDVQESSSRIATTIGLITGSMSSLFSMSDSNLKQFEELTPDAV